MTFACGGTTRVIACLSANACPSVRAGWWSSRPSVYGWYECSATALQREAQSVVDLSLALRRKRTIRKDRRPAASVEVQVAGLALLFNRSHTDPAAAAMFRRLADRRRLARTASSCRGRAQGRGGHRHRDLDSLQSERLLRSASGGIALIAIGCVFNPAEAIADNGIRNADCSPLYCPAQS